MNEVKNIFKKYKDNREITKKLNEWVDNFHFENNEKRLQVLRKELDEKQYKIWKRKKIDDIKLDYSLFMKSQLEDAQKMLNEAQKKYIEKRNKEENFLSYQRSLDKINSYTDKELEDEFGKYIGDKNYLYSEDELYIMKNRIKASTLPENGKERFYNIINEKKNNEMYRFENEIGIKGHALQNEYINEHQNFNGKFVVVKDGFGRKDNIEIKNLLADEDLSQQINDIKNEIREESFNYE
jgi:hypothetical protein